MRSRSSADPRCATAGAVIPRQRFESRRDELAVSVVGSGSGRAYAGSRLRLRQAALWHPVVAADSREVPSCWGPPDGFGARLGRKDRSTGLGPPANAWGSHHVRAYIGRSPRGPCALLGFDLDPAPAANWISFCKKTNRLAPCRCAYFIRSHSVRVAPAPAGIGWRTLSTASWVGLSSKQNHGPLWYRRLRLVEDQARLPFHVGNVGAVNLRDAPQCSLAPRLETSVVLSEAPDAPSPLARTVSSSCSVSLTIAPANNSRVQRARPSGGS